jgi:hypothetical protein
VTLQLGPGARAIKLDDDVIAIEREGERRVLRSGESAFGRTYAE